MPRARERLRANRQPFLARLPPIRVNYCTYVQHRIRTIRMRLAIRVRTNVVQMVRTLNHFAR